jgi:urea carboxylase
VSQAERVTLGDGSVLSYGGDEFVFVELSEEMSLKRTLQVIAITDEILSRSLDGVIDVCPAHVSYMLRLDPDVVDPRSLPSLLEDVHASCIDVDHLTIRGRLIEIPVLYRDPWSVETLMRFRDRHQSPDTDDLQFAAAINGFPGIESFITAHSDSPWLATFIGFVPGNAECYQLVPDERQIQTPKYLRPRTDTPERSVGHGGAFTTIYPVRGAGGFQLLGRSAVPVFDPEQTLTDFAESMVLPRSGDIFKYRSIDLAEYEEIRGSVEAGEYRYRIFPVEFDLRAFTEAPETYNRGLLEVLES